jgi:hypothetical protein
MAAGDVKLAYAASSNLTVTALNGGIASSSTHVSGWESPEVDNSTNKYLDYLVSGKFTVESSGLAVGEIRIHVVPKLDDSTWPGGFDGTESTEATPLDDANGTLAGAVLLKAITTDTTASQVYYFHGVSVASAFGGICPEKFVIFVTQSTGTTLETSGNQITIKGVYLTVAQS